ncbi:MAG: FadR/GntR family transcriptional regulator [Eubacteriales bacterium]|nr:FadR/GntR family transcriptional regulator [Eubacteriales bacterium]
MDHNEMIEKKIIPSGKTYEFVFEYFSEQILSGKLKINDKIPPEREISEKLGVSRNSIREVMHMLEINGLIECVQGSGNYVRCDPQEYMFKSVHMVMSLMNVHYTEVFHLRTGFELVALRLAIQVASEEEIEGIHEALLNMDQASDSTESGVWDAEFHKRLIAASHNRMLILYASMNSDLINTFIEDFNRRIMDSDYADALMRSHWSIYEALVNKDYTSGSLAMNRHFEIVEEQMNHL